MGLQVHVPAGRRARWKRAGAPLLRPHRRGSGAPCTRSEGDGNLPRAPPSGQDAHVGEGKRSRSLVVGFTTALSAPGQGSAPSPVIYQVDPRLLRVPQFAFLDGLPNGSDTRCRTHPPETLDGLLYVALVSAMCSGGLTSPPPLMQCAGQRPVRAMCLHMPPFDSLSNTPEPSSLPFARLGVARTAGMCPASRAAPAPSRAPSGARRRMDQWVRAGAPAARREEVAEEIEWAPSPAGGGRPLRRGSLPSGARRPPRPAACRAALFRASWMGVA
eukprot:gene7683-biopygen11829